MTRSRLLAAIALLLALPVTVAYAGGLTGRIGPSLQETGNGRVLHPAGDLVEAGNFPTGGALTPDGRFYWAVSTGRGFNDVRIIDLNRHLVVQTLPLPGASGGIAADPNGPWMYVSGVADSPFADQSRPGLPGRGGDVVQVFRYDPASGRARFDHLLPVPPPSGSPAPQGVAYVPGAEGPPQQFPPTNTTRLSWPDRLAVSPDGRTLLVPLNLADHVAVVRTGTRAVTYLAVGHFPYGAVILPDGRTGLVTNEADGTVSVIDLARGSVTATLVVGPKLSHPEGLAVDPTRHRAYVAMANTDQVAVIDTGRIAVLPAVSLHRRAGLGVSPVALALDPAAARLYVAEEGADDVAVLDVGRAAPRLAGRIPTAALPTDVAVCPPCHRLVWLSGKGLGSGPYPNGPRPSSPLDTDDRIHAFSYLPADLRGDVGSLATPGREALQRLTRVAEAQAVPVDRIAPPAGTPLRPDGPIKHVFYVVKENRTYDQVLGDVGRGDGDPRLTLFGRSVTPNVHALVDRFPLLDHVYANSDASIDGHMWASAADVSDYTEKNWFQNYAERGRPYDFGEYAVSAPPGGYLFDQAQRQGVSYFNYGETIDAIAPFPDKDRSAAGTAAVLQRLAHSDIGEGGPGAAAAGPAGECYPSDISIGYDAVLSAAQVRRPVYDASPPPGASPSAQSRADCFTNRLHQQELSGTVPSLSYLVLPNDHTRGTAPGSPTPQAMVADNDYGLGQIVDTITHSSVWASSAIFVVEDDTQDGADHVDAHRMPAEVISPYTIPGAVVHERYDFASVLRSIELVLGLEPMNLFDGSAEPMYAAFTATPANPAPYSAIVPRQDRLALNTAASPDAAESAGLDFSRLDQVPQRTLDRILWQAVRGTRSPAPPPGPHANDRSSG